MKRLSFYMVDAAYCDYLRTGDPCVPYTMDKKARRPFVGVVLEVNGASYYAPLTSPKPKHRTMKNQIDFLKINGGIYGAINFNNMIPIHPNSLIAIDMNIHPTDPQNIVHYKNLLINQLNWCNSNRETILKKAETLYNIIINHTGAPSLVTRCCNFLLDEQNMKQYVQQKGWI